MAAYASGTSVDPAKSRMELERTLKRYGATAFGYAQEEDGRAAVQFRKDGRLVVFEIRVPPVQHFMKTPRNVARTKAQAVAAREKEERRLWRALALCIKAKLEAVQSGLVTFEEEFIAHVLLPDGMRVGQWLAPQVEHAYQTGDMPTTLPAASTPLLEA